MSRLLKWSLESPGVTHVELPSGARVLHVDYQGEQLRIWTLEPSSPVRERWEFLVVETGGYVDEGVWDFVGSAQGLWRGSPYVAHVFRRPL